MFALQVEDSSQIHDRSSIEFHANDACPTRRSKAQYPFIIFGPNEMLAPFVFARIVKGNFLLANGIKGLGLGVLEIVTALTGECPIVRLMFSTFALRENVFDGKTMRGKCFLTQTVFAASICTPINYFTICG